MATLYHGSYHDLAAGAVLRAGTVPGNWNNAGSLSASVVWLTDDPDDARYWAVEAIRGRQRGGLHVQPDPDFTAEPRVYEVEPIGSVIERDAPSNIARNGIRHYTAEQARVVGLVRVGAKAMVGLAPMVGCKTASPLPNYPLLYMAETEARRAMGWPILPKPEAESFYRKVLTGEGVPRANEAYVQNGKSSTTSNPGWQWDRHPPIPFLALGAEMYDRMTIVHEAAHQVNGSKILKQYVTPTDGRDEYEMGATTHDQAWTTLYFRMLRKYAPDVLEALDYQLSGKPVHERAAAKTAATERAQRVYNTSARIRETAKKLTMLEAGQLAVRILGDAGFPQAEFAHAVPHPKGGNTSSVAWLMDWNPPVPIIALGSNMMDELTTIHECAHILRNGPGHHRNAEDDEEMHDEEWFDTWHRLMVRYATPKCWRTFEWEFNLGPSQRVAKTATYDLYGTFDVNTYIDKCYENSSWEDRDDRVAACWVKPDGRVEAVGHHEEYGYKEGFGERSIRVIIDATSNPSAPYGQPSLSVEWRLLGEQGGPTEAQRRTLMTFAKEFGLERFYVEISNAPFLDQPHLYDDYTDATFTSPGAFNQYMIQSARDHAMAKSRVAARADWGKAEWGFYQEGYEIGYQVAATGGHLDEATKKRMGKHGDFAAGVREGLDAGKGKTAAIHGTMQARQWVEWVFDQREKGETRMSFPCWIKPDGSILAVDNHEDYGYRPGFGEGFVRAMVNPHRSVYADPMLGMEWWLAHDYDEVRPTEGQRRAIITLINEFGLESYWWSVSDPDGKVFDNGSTRSKAELGNRLRQPTYASKMAATNFVPRSRTTARAYHWTSGANASSIRQRGLSRQYALGHTYAEGDLIWFATTPRRWMNLAEDLAEKGKDPYLVTVDIPVGTPVQVGYTERGVQADNSHADGQDFALDLDVPPEWIVSVEPLSRVTARKTASYHVRCSDGQVRWGPHGAAGVLFKNGDRYYLVKRGAGVDQGGSWGIPGGAIDDGETPEQAAKREAREEIGYEGQWRVVHTYVDQPCPEWAYTTFVVEVDKQHANEENFDWETDEDGWFTQPEMMGLYLHPAFRAALPSLLRGASKTAAGRPYTRGFNPVISQGQAEALLTCLNQNRLGDAARLVLEYAHTDQTATHDGVGSWWASETPEIVGGMYGSGGDLRRNDDGTWEFKSYGGKVKLGVNLVGVPQARPTLQSTYFDPGTEFIIEKVRLYYDDAPPYGYLVSKTHGWLDLPAHGLRATAGEYRRTGIPKPGLIYRGMKVEFPREIAEQIEAALQMPYEEEHIGQHFKAGPIILDYIQHHHWDREMGLGRHWTGRKEMATTAAWNGPGWGVVLTAEWDGNGLDSTDDERGYGMTLDTESEATLLPGARLKIVGVEIRDGQQWRQVLQQPIQATAVNRSDEMPAQPPDTKPIPAGHHYLTHRTPLRNADSIRQSGLGAEHSTQLEFQGEMVWGTAGFYHSCDVQNAASGNFCWVEYHVPWDPSSSYRLNSPYTSGSVPPENIIAVWEPWHLGVWTLVQEVADNEARGSSTRGLEEFAFIRNEGEGWRKAYDWLQSHQPPAWMKQTKITRVGGLHSRVSLEHGSEEVGRLRNDRGAGRRRPVAALGGSAPNQGCRPRRVEAFGGVSGEPGAGRGVHLSRSAQRDLEKLPREIQREVADALRGLARGEGNIKALKGWKKFYRLRVADKYRIVYEDQGNLGLEVWLIKRRSEVYEVMKRRLGAKTGGIFDFYRWEWKLQDQNGTGRNVAQAGGDSLIRRVCQDYGIDPASVTLKIEGWDAQTDYNFNTGQAVIQLGLNVKHQWGLLHEIAHLILFHRRGPEHDFPDGGMGHGFGGHNQALANLLAELLAKYAKIEIDPTTMSGSRPAPARARAKLAAKRRIYHGTNQAALDAIKRDGEFRTMDPERVAHDIEDRYGLSRGSVWNHPYNSFSHGRQRDRHIYFSGKPDTAAGYARIGSEVVFDSLNAAWHILADPFDGEGNYKPGKAQEKDRWMKEETEKHYAPVVLACEVPWETFSSSHQEQWSRLPTPMTEERYDEIMGGTAEDTISLEGPVSASIIVGVQKVGVSIEAPTHESLVMYHGTTRDAWEEIKRGGFARTPDPLKLCHDIEDEFKLPRGSVWKLQNWSKKRRKESTVNNLYLTTDRKQAEGYAFAGSAPLYDALVAAYHVAFPEKIKQDFFGATAEGLQPWLRDQILRRGGGPVLITFDVPEPVIRESWEVHQREMTYRSQGGMTWSQIKAWLLTGNYVRQDGISWERQPGTNMVRYVESVEMLEQPARIKTQNAKRPENGSNPPRAHAFVAV